MRLIYTRHTYVGRGILATRKRLCLCTNLNRLTQNIYPQRRLFRSSVRPSLLRRLGKRFGGRRSCVFGLGGMVPAKLLLFARRKGHDRLVNKLNWSLRPIFCRFVAHYCWHKEKLAVEKHRFYCCILPAYGLHKAFPMPTPVASGRPAFSQVEMQQAVAIDNFIGGKNEEGLWALFAFREIMDINIQLYQDGITGRRIGHPVHPGFDYVKGRRQLVDRARIGVTQIGGGLGISLGKNDVDLIILPRLTAIAKTSSFTFSIREPFQNLSSDLSMIFMKQFSTIPTC